MRAYSAQKGKRAATSAARNYVRSRLGWLNGYPEAIEDGTTVTWRALPLPGSRKSAEIIEISRELLRKSEFARNAARRRFPHALQHVVGDVGAWTRSTEARLNILKAAVHDGARLPGLEAIVAAADLRRAVRVQIRKLHRRYASFAPLLSALVWRHWEDVEALQNSINHLEAHRDNIANLLDRLPAARGVADALVCLDLVCDGCDPWFLGLLGDPQFWDVPLANGIFPACLAKCLKTLKSDGARALDLTVVGFARPETRCATDLLDQINRIAGNRQRIRDLQLRLLELLIPEDIAPAWAAWWHKADELEREMKVVVKSGWTKASRQDRVNRKALSQRIDEELQPLPVVNLRKHTKTLDRLSGITRHKAVDAMLDCLSALPATLRATPAVTSFLEHWLDVLENSDAGRNQAIVLLRAQQKLLGKIPGTQSDQYIWALGQLPHSLCDTWIEQKKSIKLVEPAIAALTHLLTEQTSCHQDYGPLQNYCGWEALTDAAGIMSTPRLAADVLTKVAPDELDLNGEIWAALLHHSGPSIGRFGTMAKTWRAQQPGLALTDEILLLLEETSLSEVVTSALFLGDGKRIVRAIALSSLSRSLAARPVLAPPRKIPGGVRLTNYPAELQPLLRELELWDRNFSQAVEQILGSDFPDHQQLEVELATVNQLADASGGPRRQSLLARAGALSRQLNEPPVVSDQRIANLRAKLDQRVHHARMVEWESRLMESVQTGLEDKSGQVPPDQLFDDADTILVLSGLASLATDFRNLAYQLLMVRSGPGPWDLRDHGANAAFITRMRKRYRVEP
ncbi:MAG: hypothetical protein OER56_11685, partial [Hyphomicrobiales bacterium]|nr:hypothetical protein [Hyphomicrobiales bacterium]